MEKVATRATKYFILILSLFSLTYRASILKDIKRLFPELGPKMHKGQDGKICVLGGSKEYTGAPYYAAISSLRAGGDLGKYNNFTLLQLASSHRRKQQAQSRDTLLN